MTHLIARRTRRALKAVLLLIRPHDPPSVADVPTVRSSEPRSARSAPSLHRRRGDSTATWPEAPPFRVGLVGEPDSPGRTFHLQRVPTVIAFRPPLDGDCLPLIAW